MTVNNASIKPPSALFRNDFVIAITRYYARNRLNSERE